MVYVVVSVLSVFVLSQALPVQPDFVTSRSGNLDFPSAPIKAVYGLPFTGSQVPGAELDNPGEPEEIGDVPLEEEPLDPPVFFGQPVSGKVVLVLDRSGSMGVQDGGGSIEDANGNSIASPTRMQILKAEAIRLLQRLSDDDWFAIVSFGYPSLSCYENLVQATPGNVFSGIMTINNLTPNGGTPAYSALRTGCQKYGQAIDHLFFVCDGYPSHDASSPGPAYILVDFPVWFAPLKLGGCEFTCVHIGSDLYSTQFMSSLANSVGGTYIKR